MANAWATNHRRYFEFAERTLDDLCEFADQVLARWPPDAPPYLLRSEMPDDLRTLCRRRDAHAVATTVFCGMAIESFINYYGVYRVGESEFNRRRRKPLTLPEKLRLLLGLDNIHLSDSHEMIVAFRLVTEARNRLVHEKAQEVAPDQPPEQRMMDRIPETQRQHVAACRRFFEEFATLLPAHRPLLPH